jgi:hypothetical protein
LAWGTARHSKQYEPPGWSGGYLKGTNNGRLGAPPPTPTADLPLLVFFSTQEHTHGTT